MILYATVCSIICRHTFTSISRSISHLFLFYLYKKLNTLRCRQREAAITYGHGIGATVEGGCMSIRPSKLGQLMPSTSSARTTIDGRAEGGAAAVREGAG